MPLITGSIPNLVNGVSQQPAVLRLSSQGESQLNCLSSVAEGLSKRPPTEHIARLEGVSKEAYFHTINRDSNERYNVAIEDTNIKVYDLSGQEKTVNFPNGKAYLDSSVPKEAFQCVTVADYTFILNKTVNAKAETELSPERPNEALVWVRQGAYGSTYKVIIDGVAQASYTVPDGSNSSHSTSVTTTNIANQLRTQLASNLSSNFTVSISGSVIHISNAAEDFSLNGVSPNGDTFMVTVKESVQSFNDLPSAGVNGFTVEVAGDNNSQFDNYYVKYESEDELSSNGVWRETVKSGEEYKINPSTMPHALVREADGTFTFKTIEWLPRQVGDSESSPMPSFIDRGIADIFFYRNRLGFAADENIIFSRAGDFFNFFRGTATTTLDDDPIDVGVSHVKVSLIKQVLPFNESLLLFSDQTQFQTGEASTLTPETISINVTTEYECSLDAKPVGIGKYVYFATQHGKFSGVREYFVDTDTESEQAAEVTAHVPKYIKGKITQLTASSSEDALVVRTDEDLSAIYIYKFYFNDNDKLQASWSRWETGDKADILDCSFIESQLFIKVSRADGVHLEVVNLSSEVVEEDWDILVHLDRKLNYTQVTTDLNPNVPSPTGVTPTGVTLPYKLTTTDNFVAVTGPDGVIGEGTLLVPLSIDNSGSTSIVYFDADLTSQKFYVGLLYESRYRLSTLYVRDNVPNGGQVAVTQGRLQLRKMDAILGKSGYLRAEVTPHSRQKYTYVFNGSVLGSSEYVLGKTSLRNGVLSFPILTRNETVDIEFVNDSFMYFSILSLDWEGLYTERATRV